MATRYFVKEPVTEENCSAYVRIGNLGGGPVGLGKYDILYEGEDKGLAEGIAKNLNSAVLSEYNSSDRGVLITHTNYREGEWCGSATKGTPLKNPLGYLIHENAKEGNHIGRTSLSGLFAEFTAREVEFLNGLEAQVRAA